MHSKRIRIWAMTAMMVLGSASHAQEQVTPVTLVKVDDFPVTNLHFALFASQTGRNPQDAPGQMALLNELVNNFMVANSAQGRTLAADPEVVAALEVARARLIAQAFVRTQMDSITIDEEQLREIYDSEYAAGEREYKARHILLKTEEDARAVIAELDGGADFATLARERSTGPSKTAGGDLGWFEADQMVSEFSIATQALDDGSHTRTPVQTRFGWHVILREESRELPRPEFDAVRPEIEQRLQQQQIAATIEDIRNNTRIEVEGAEDKE